ncbi:BTAD domain-containing putative transcriptional regulator [Rathayibacter oskolensis]|uniref:BTAD domain-containing putative transcriptional regulator n=1 Tax=Rathayibacter oskolensis TaxID=1891671 RepID=UPI00265EFDB2|nr:BTAD domain-containing putative transcriptional regulator [Rathayibacter oskolensis]WKK70666.1 BTAD domain-containing putative transcriptional regulator [Rathayibacter oskolensis]
MVGTAFVVLGEIGALVGGRAVQIRGRRERAVLAMLLAAHRRAVPAERLLEAVWGVDAAATAAPSLQVAISRLRSQLDPGRGPRGVSRLLVTTGLGYALHPDVDALDAEVFERTTDDAVAALSSDRAEDALAHADAAIGLWRGGAYAGAPDAEDIAAERERLEQLRLVAIETRADALLALGRHAIVAGEVPPLIEAHPFRERLWVLGALAQYRDGRQAEALALLRRARRTLADELGIDPSAALQQLETAMLDQDGRLLPPPAPPLVRRGGRRPSRSPATPSSRSSGHSRRRSRRAPPLRRDRGRARHREDASARDARRVVRVHRHGDGVGRCADAESVPAYAPWTDLLRQLERRGTAIPADPAHSPPSRSVLEEEASAERRFRVFDRAADAVASAAQNSSLVILLEDLHWADTATAELLTHLTARLQDVPVLVVVTMRELALGRADAVASAVSAIVRRAGSRRIVLRPLPPAASEALLAEVADRAVDPAVAEAIHRRGGGNPFCMGELARLLAADGLLDDQAAVETARVPTAVRDVVRRRLSALPPATRSLLEVASVIGRAVDLPLLIAASDQPAEDCLDALEPALVHRVLLDDPEVPGRFRFAHALVDEAAIAECSSLRAARIHLRVARALQAAGGEIEAIAGHLWSASVVVDPGEVADTLERAAAVASARTAYERADVLLERAVAARRSASESLRPGAREAEVGTILRMAGLLRPRFGYRAAFESVPFERAQQVASTLDRSDLVMALLHLQWGAAATGGDVAEATAVAGRMLALGRSDRDPVVRVVAHHAWGVQCWHLARLREGAAEMCESWSLLERFTDEEFERLGAYDCPALFGAFATHVLDLAGAVDDADDRFDRLIDRFPGSDAAVAVRNFQGYSSLVAGDAPRLLAWNARHGFSGRVEERLGMFAASSTFYSGWAAAVSGDADTGLADMDDGLARYTALGARTAYGALVDAQVEALLIAGRPVPQVEALLAAGAAVVEASGEPHSEASLDLARARVAAAKGRTEEMRAALAAAIDAADRSGNVRLAAAARRVSRRHSPALVTEAD